MNVGQRVLAIGAAEQPGKAADRMAELAREIGLRTDDLFVERQRVLDRDARMVARVAATDVALVERAQLVPAQRVAAIWVFVRDGAQRAGTA